MSFSISSATTASRVSSGFRATATWANSIACRARSKVGTTSTTYVHRRSPICPTATLSIKCLRSEFAGRYTRSCNVGLLDFSFDDGPRMSYTLHSTIGAPVWDPLVLTPADLAQRRLNVAYKNLRD